MTLRLQAADSLLRHRSAVVSGLVVLGALAGFGLLKLLRIPGKRVTSPEVWEYALAAQKTASQFDTSPIEPSMDGVALVDSLVAALPEAVPAGERGERIPVDSADVREILSLVVDFLRVRSLGDPQAYASWAREQGLRLIDSLDEIYPPGIKFANIYRIELGREPPEAITPTRLFEDMYLDNSQASADALRAVGVITEAPAVEVSFGRVRVFQDLLVLPAFKEVRSDSLGISFWVGGSGQFCTRMWQSERSLEDLARRHRDGARAASLRLMVEGASGLRVPMSYVVLHDDVAGAWRIEAMWLNNIGADPGRTLLTREAALYVF